jgi:hypothetical protein
MLDANNDGLDIPADLDRRALVKKFDPIAVGDQIKSHIDQADKAKAIHDEHVRAAGKLLLDVATNHPKQMDAICKRIGLGDSRRYELLAIAGGRKTLAESRAQNNERQKRFRKKRRFRNKNKSAAQSNGASGANGAPLHPGVTEPAGNNVDPDASADAMKAAHAAQDGSAKPPLTPEEIAARSNKWALREIKMAVRRFAKHLTEAGMQEAVEYLTSGDWRNDNEP